MEIIDKRRIESSPEVDGELVPFLSEMIWRRYDKPIRLADAFEPTLQHLIDGGSAEQKMRAAIALEKSRLRAISRDGNTTAPTITWGPRAKCLEFESQDASFGALHFTAIDIGGT